MNNLLPKKKENQSLNSAFNPQPPGLKIVTLAPKGVPPPLTLSKFCYIINWFKYFKNKTRQRLIQLDIVEFCPQEIFKAVLAFAADTARISA